jgi:ribonuclease J
MVNNTAMARELGYLDIPDEMMVDLRDIDRLPPDEVVIMATGAQGEPMAVLNRLATGRHHTLRIQKDDTVVLSSHTIPGNEEMIHEVINRLFQKGADVYYDPVADVHVSGHASQEEQKTLINMLQPRYFLPIHGELRHLMQHAKIARSLGIPAENIAAVENGYTLTFRHGEMAIGERVPGGYVYVDGTLVGEIGPRVMRQRGELGEAGFVTAVVRFNPRTGRASGQPRIVTRGFVFRPGAEDLLTRAQDVVRSAAMVSPGTKLADVEANIERALSSFLHRETRRDPVVTAAVVDVT